MTPVTCKCQTRDEFDEAVEIAKYKASIGQWSRWWADVPTLTVGWLRHDAASN